jgi:hypothetical protein
MNYFSQAYVHDGHMYEKFRGLPFYGFLQLITPRFDL